MAHGQASHPKKIDDRWTLQELSIEAKAIVEVSARQEGLEIGEWLERLILHSAQPQLEPPPTAADPALLRALNTIEKRLERIEDQKGFWKRLWEQVKKQMDEK